MINSEKLSLFRDGTSNSVGLTDITLEVLNPQENLNGFTLTLNKEVISKLTNHNDWDEKNMVRTRFLGGLFGSKYCLNRVTRKTKADTDLHITEEGWHCIG